MKKLWVENIQTNPAAFYQENTLGENYVDRSNDAVAWDLYGKQVMDYLFYRDKINTLLIIKSNPNYPSIDFSGWGLLTNEERELMARYILAPYSLRLTVYSDQIDEQNWFELLRITQGTEIGSGFTGRAYLIEKMRKHVANYVRKELLTMSQSQQFFKDVSSILQWYIHSAAPDFKLWLYGQGDYVGQFENANYYSLLLQSELINLYETGGY